VGADQTLVHRPSHFFDPKGCLPEVVPLKLTTPPGFPSAEVFRAHLRAALAEREAMAVKKFGSFLGKARILSQKTTARTRAKEPLGRLHPRVAARDSGKRVAALERLVGFLADYRSALCEWRQGKRSTVFPAGTYLMRIACGVNCAGAG
jgi:hypothetical protein